MEYYPQVPLSVLPHGLAPLGDLRAVPEGGGGEGEEKGKGKETGSAGVERMKGGWFTVRPGDGNITFLMLYQGLVIYIGYESVTLLDYNG